MASLIPAGPDEIYDVSGDLLTWLNANFRRFGDVYRASIYGRNVYVVSDPVLARHVLRDNWQNYKKGVAIKRVALLLGNGLMVSEGEFWKTQRRMLQPAFQQNAISALIDVITTANLALRDKWQLAAQMNQAVNITQDISATILEIVLKVVFGNDYPRIAPSFAVVASEQTRDMQFARTFRAAREIIFDIAAQRRAGQVDRADMLGVMLAARDRTSHQPMPDNQVVNEIMTLIVAGHETTASTLNWTWYLLARHPDVQQRLAAELGSNRSPPGFDLTKFAYARQVLEEAMRLYPSGWLMTRRALHDDQIGDYFVPAGTEVYIAPYLIQRNPRIWDAPETFDPGRFDPNRGTGRHELAMLPFSAGPRNCIGEHLARLEMLLNLILIGERLRLHCDSDFTPEIEAGVNLRGKHDFIMRPQLRSRVSGAVGAGQTSATRCLPGEGGRGSITASAGGTAMREKIRDIRTRAGEMETFIVHPERQGPHPVVFMLMDAPGIRDELYDMARRLSTVGYYVVLPNLYYRAGKDTKYGPDVTTKGSAEQARMRAVRTKMTIPPVMEDFADMLGFVASQPAAKHGPVGAHGYCMSGPYALAAAARFPDRVAAAASFYGTWLISENEESPHLNLAKAKGELYIGCAEHDELAPLPMVAELQELLAQSGNSGELEMYPEVHHGFAFPQRWCYDKPAAERHWERLIALYRRRLG